MLEGQFYAGYLNGFGRKLDSNSECQIGYWYWKNTIPSHKWNWYLLKGNSFKNKIMYTGKKT